jgi:uncharacterized membrane protein
LTIGTLVAYTFQQLHVCCSKVIHANYLAAGDVRAQLPVGGVALITNEHA